MIGYVSDTYLQNGTSGGLIHQEHKQYYGLTATGGGITIYPVANDTVYGNADGSDARETQYSYTLYSGTAAINKQRGDSWVHGSMAMTLFNTIVPPNGQSDQWTYCSPSASAGPTAFRERQNLPSMTGRSSR